MHVICALLGALIVTASSAVAAESQPSAVTLVQQMKEAFEPVRPSTRTVVIAVSDLGETLRFTARQARKQLPDGKRLVTVLLAPPDVRGTAFLVSESKSKRGPSAMWIYSPVIRRVRKLIPIDAYDHFMDTDFTYADLGFVRLHDHYKFLGVEEHAGVKAYKVQETVPQEQWYYSRVITWIAVANKLPLEQDFYDPAGALWKTELFDTVTDVDGVPTILHIQMKDVQAKTSTDLMVSDVRYDVDVPDSIFDPTKLGTLADHPLWKANGKAK